MAAPSYRPRRRRTFAGLAFFVALVAATGLSLAPPPAHSPVPAVSAQEFVRGIDAAVLERTAAIAGYSVQERYTLFRNGEANPSAELTVRTVYARSTGKDYTPISTSGSSLLRRVVLDRVIANEKEMASAANRENVSLTSSNYEMRPEPGVVSRNGRDCVIVDLKARRKTPFLFNGKGWFDAADHTLVHIEGSPAASPSFFAGATAGVRDYTKIEGFSMALHAEIHSHSLLFGDSLLKIDYSNYQIQSDPKASTASK